MRNFERLLQEVENSCDVVNPRDHDPLIVAQIAQHICVRLSGILEQAIKDCIYVSLSQGCQPRTASFIGRELSDFQNPKPEKIARLFESIDKSWLEQLKNFWEPVTKDAIGSIVSNRNKIAHGESSSVTINQIKSWLSEVKRFCNFLQMLK